jgi:hypothetical protein
MAEQKTEKQEGKGDVKRLRSPNFPYSSVRDCVELITRLNNAVGTTKIPIVLAFSRMGLSPRSSSTDRIRASLSSYGLTKEEIINKEKFVRLSQLGLRIVTASRDAERLAACREAALNDGMMKKIWNSEWKRGLPPDNGAIVENLKSIYKFQDEAARRFATVLKDNYQFCQLATYIEGVTDEAPVDSDEAEPKPDGSGYNQGKMDNKPFTPPEKIESTVRYPIPLDDDRFAYIYLPSAVNADDAQFIREYTDLLLKKLRRSQKANEQEE